MADTTQLSQLEQSIAEYENESAFNAEGEATQVIERAILLMELKGWSRARLAKEMGVQRAYVSRMFNTPPNFTFDSLFKLGMALGVTPRVILDSEHYLVLDYAEPLSWEDVKIRFDDGRDKQVAGDSSAAYALTRGISNAAD